MFLFLSFAIYQEGFPEGDLSIPQMDATYLAEFFLLNIGLILILFGYSTLSYHRGVSVNSQKLIYYLGIIYFLVNH